MPVELRKRPPPKETATPPPTAKRGSGTGAAVKKLADKAKAVINPKNGAADPPATNGAAPNANGSGGTGAISSGTTINLDGFGGTIQTHEGKDVTLKQLVEDSLAGVVIFTYPRASTPGCKSAFAVQPINPRVKFAPRLNVVPIVNHG